ALPTLSLFQSLPLPRVDPHPGLPSFPTRRSSDLGHTPLTDILSIAFEGGEVTTLGSLQNPELRTARTPRTATVNMSLLQWDAARSEEHTSELQSRFDLVCRLLLEKKNKEISDMDL